MSRPGDQTWQCWQTTSSGERPRGTLGVAAAPGCTRTGFDCPPGFCFCISIPCRGSVSSGTKILFSHLLSPAAKKGRGNRERRRDAIVATTRDVSPPRCVATCETSRTWLCAAVACVPAQKDTAACCSELLVIVLV